jgi:hypothetical protein
MDPDTKREIAVLQAQAKIELDKLESASPAREVAGKAIGKNGLLYITIIVIVGVAASMVLDKDKIAAVMGLLGASLTALIQMVNGVAGTAAKQEKPEFEVIKNLIEKLDRISSTKDPMSVKVEGDKVTVTKGDDTITSGR